MNKEDNTTAKTGNPPNSDESQKSASPCAQAAEQAQEAPVERKLCTCGKSKNYPYCDGGTHDDETAAERKFTKVKSKVEEEEKGDFDF